MKKPKVTINIVLRGKDAEKFLDVKAMRESSGSSLAKFAIKKLLNDEQYLESLK